MNKLTAGIFVGILAVVTAGNALADIASTTYVTKKIEALDVSENKVTDGKYVTSITQVDGKVVVAADNMDTTPTTGSQKPVTSGGVASAIAGAISSANTANDALAGRVKSLEDSVNDETTGLDSKQSVANLVGDTSNWTQETLKSTSKYPSVATTQAMIETALTENVDGDIADLHQDIQELGEDIASLRDDKQDKLGYTAENVANKTTTISAAADASDTKYPTEKAVASALAGKQGSLSTAQLNAANSGITSDKVSAYDTHVANNDIHVTAAQKATWSGKQDKLSDTQMAAVNSGITSDKVSTYDGYAAQIAGKQASLGYTAENVANKTKTIAAAASASDDKYPTEKAVASALAGKQASGDYATNSALTTGLAGKQDSLSTAQLAAANSGITSDKVSTYDGYAAQIAGKQAAGDYATNTALNNGLAEKMDKNKNLADKLLTTDATSGGLIDAAGAAGTKPTDCNGTKCDYVLLHNGTKFVWTKVVNED